MSKVKVTMVCWQENKWRGENKEKALKNAKFVLDICLREAKNINKMFIQMSLSWKFCKQNHKEPKSVTKIYIKSPVPNNWTRLPSKNGEKYQQFHCIFYMETKKNDGMISKDYL